MHYAKYLVFGLIGIAFGLVLTKGEIISWYRIQEMFRFDSFHMYGIIGSAVVIGIAAVALIKKHDIKSVGGEKIEFQPKARSISRYLLGGSIFGIGWALTGACPGPMYILVGNGFSVFLVVVASAVMGTFTYGLLRARLPH